MIDKKIALITGISGQDGSYLAEYLLDLGYEVHGIIRRVSVEDPDHRLFRIAHIRERLTFHTCSLENYPGILNVFKDIKPDECYHLAGHSFVSYVLENEFSTMNTNINTTHHVLSALNSGAPNCRFYFAGSSEMFGNADVVPQNEKTHFNPRSAYGISKVAGHELTCNYRDNHKIFACTGFQYNHESPRRGLEFVTRKISSTAAKIKLGMASEIRLGNIQAQRDWGFAGDYVKAIHSMLQQEIPQDFVIGTGEMHTVEELLEIAFSHLDLDYKKYLVIDKDLFRPTETQPLKADASKAKDLLGWSPQVSFKELISMMVDYDMSLLQSSNLKTDSDRLQLCN